MPLGRRRMGRPGLVGTVARTAVVAGTASAVAGGVNRRQQQKYAAKDEQAAEAQAYEQQQYEAQQAAQQPQYPPPAAAPAPAAGLGDDMIEQLKQLGALHEQGILTDEEFAAQKAKILAG